MAGHGRAERSKEEQVEFLLRKTVENGATPGEEVSAVQLAHMIVRQHSLDMDAFKAALARIGSPPRYRITADGFLVPNGQAERPGAADGGSATGRKADTDPADGGGAGSVGDDLCPVSPTHRHRKEKIMHGTFATGLVYCIHCGLRRDPGAAAT